MKKFLSKRPTGVDAHCHYAAWIEYGTLLEPNKNSKYGNYCNTFYVWFNAGLDRRKSVVLYKKKLSN